MFHYGFFYHPFSVFSIYWHLSVLCANFQMVIFLKGEFTWDMSSGNHIVHPVVTRYTNTIGVAEFATADACWIPAQSNIEICLICKEQAGIQERKLA